MTYAQIVAKLRGIKTLHEFESLAQDSLTAAFPFIEWGHARYHHKPLPEQMSPLESRDSSRAVVILAADAIGPNAHGLIWDQLNALEGPGTGYRLFTLSPATETLAAALAVIKWKEEGDGR